MGVGSIFKSSLKVKKKKKKLVPKIKCLFNCFINGMWMIEGHIFIVSLNNFYRLDHLLNYMSASSHFLEMVQQ